MIQTKIEQLNYESTLPKVILTSNMDQQNNQFKKDSTTYSNFQQIYSRA